MENQLTPNNSMILEIRELLENARKNVAQQVNTQPTGTLAGLSWSMNSKIRFAQIMENKP